MKKLYIIVLFGVGSAYVVWCCLVLSWHVVKNLCFRYCIECLVVSDEGNNALAEVADLDVNIPQEGISRPLFHHHDCLWIHSGYKELLGKP